MCRTPEEIANFGSKKKVKKGEMSEADEKVCIRIMFELYNQYPESVAFRDCSDLNFEEYLAVIKEPIALDLIKEKLDRDNPEMVSNDNNCQACFHDFFNIVFSMLPSRSS